MHAWVSSVSIPTPFLYWHCLMVHAHSQRQRQRQGQAELQCITGPGLPGHLIQISLLWGSWCPRGRLQVSPIRPTNFLWNIPSEGTRCQNHRVEEWGPATPWRHRCSRAVQETPQPLHQWHQWERGRYHGCHRQAGERGPGDCRTNVHHGY